MTVIAGNLRLGARETRRAYLGSTLVFAAEQTRWGTDFSEYPAGSPPRDWTRFDSGFLETWEITSGGLISGNRMRMRHNSTTSSLRTAFFLWDALPEVENSEVLLLASRGASNNLNNLHGAGQRLRVNSATDNAGLFLGARNNATDITFRRISDGRTSFEPDNLTHGSSYDAGNAFWMRCRCDGTNYRLKGWLADTGKEDLGLSDEPSSWQLDGAFATITGTGKTGVTFASFSSTPEQNEVFVHYFGVGIDGDSAPLPAFAPVRTPIPDPDPDPGAFDTFDSTATSFDSTAHTFDEVA